jgi:hypothetical protein
MLSVISSKKYMDFRAETTAVNKHRGQNLSVKPAPEYRRRR